jgi:hypothetical protein
MTLRHGPRLWFFFLLYLLFEEDKKNKPVLRTAQIPEKYRGNSPRIRDLRTYEVAMERRTVNG